MKVVILDRPLVMTQETEISVVVPVVGRWDDVETLFESYTSALDATGLSYQFIYVLNGEYPDVAAALQRLRTSGHPIQIIAFMRSFGEAAALTAGFSHSTSPIVVTLPAFAQVDAAALPELLSGLKDHHMVVARRHPRLDSRLNVLQSRIFNALLGLLVDFPCRDLGCSVRALRREVVNETVIYGDLHRFLPLLAHIRGFRVREIDMPQAKEDAFLRLYSPGVYLRRVLDILGAVFIAKFTRKPLRFFGVTGSFVIAIGLVSSLLLIVGQIFFGYVMTSQYVFMLAMLMIVLGIQLVSVGLIGELIIYTGKKEKGYYIEKIIN